MRSSTLHQPGRAATGAATRCRRLVGRAQPEKPGSGGGRQPWDIGRFISTVTFFNKPSNLQKSLQGFVDGLAKTISGGKVQGGAAPVPVAVAPAAAAAAESALNPVIPVPGVDGVILVTGATGGVGKRVVGKLLQAGKRVRALVRDLPKAQQLLSNLPAGAGGSLELVAADLTQPQTLLPEYFTGVRAVVSCSAVKVAPKEGDDDRRSKYMQGIKFYDPQIIGDTPESVELGGMRSLLSKVAQHLGTVQGFSLLKGDGSGSVWGPLDDVVMGGVSQSSITSVPGAGENGEPAMVFSGNVSTDNSGGFASVRCRNLDPPADLSAYEGIEIRLKGDGQRYKMILRPDANWDGIAMCHSFDTRPGEWQTVRIPFREFFPVFRARRVKDGPPLDPSQISSIQLMLSKFEYDGELNPSFRKGQFSLPVSYIRSYLPTPVTPRLVHVSSAGVTRPNRPGIDVEQEPPAVKLNAALGGLLDFKLAAEDEVRHSGVPAAIVRPCALTEEPRGMPIQLDQGDTIKGKIGREDVAELVVALLSQPAATDVTFEIKSTVPFSQPWQVDAANPPAVRDWGSVLQQAQLVPGVTGKTIDGVYTGKEPESKFIKVAEKQRVVA